MIQTEIPCSECGQPMVEHRFSKHYVSACNNQECSLRRAPQGYREIATPDGFPPLKNLPPLIK